MKKMLVAICLMMFGAVAFAQSPITSIKSIYREGSPDSVDAAYFRIYNTGGTSSYSYVTIESDATNVFTVSSASETISTNMPQITVTFATGLAVGNYSGNITIVQTNAPVTTRTIPVSLRVLKSYLTPWGTSGDPRRVEGTTVDTTKWTPRYFGDILVGNDGGTATVWIANGLTTNDWHKPAP